MSTIKTFCSVVLVGAYILMFSGCEREGPAERAGEKINEGEEQAGEALEEAGEKARDTAK